MRGIITTEKPPEVSRVRTVFFTNTTNKGCLLRLTAHMPPFISVNASGLVKSAGSDPPGFPGRNSGPRITVTLGYFFAFFCIFPLQIARNKV